MPDTAERGAAPTAADQLRRQRQTLGLTLREAAERTGVSASMLCDLERGRRSFSPRIRDRIQSGLGTQPPSRVIARLPTAVSSPILVGRDAELARLLHAIAHPPALVAVTGEAGVGKSRLVSEVLERTELRHLHRLAGRCHPLREPLALGPVLDAIRQAEPDLQPRSLSPVVGSLRPLLPELDSRLPRLPAALARHGAGRHQLFRAVREVLAHLGPTVLVLEDLHWADEPTSDLLRWLLADPPPQLVLVLTYRREDLPCNSPLPALGRRPVPPVTCDTIDLAPLAAPDVRWLLEAILDRNDVSEQVASCVHQRTSGLPFAVEELVRLVQDPGDAEGDGGERSLAAAFTSADVPPAVRDLVMERVARLSVDARRIVEAAAVAQVPEREDALSAAAGLAADLGARALCEAMRAAILTEAGADRYALRHPLAHQAVYESLPHPERRRLHRRLARALQAVEPERVGALAEHYRRAGLQGDWVRCAEAAADVAAARFDDESAARLLGEVLNSPALSEPDIARLAPKLMRVGAWAHQCRPQTTSVLRRLISERSLPASVRTELSAQLGLLEMHTGQADAGYRRLAESLSDLRRVPALQAKVMASLAVPLVLEGDEAEHLRWLTGASEAAASEDDPSLDLSLRVAQAMVLLSLGRSEGWAAVQHMLELEPRRTEDERMLLWGISQAAGAAFLLGHYDQAGCLLEEATNRAQRLGKARFLPVSETWSLMLQWARGDWEGLEARARQHTAAATDLPRWSALSALLVGRLALARHDLDEAERWLAAASRLALEGGMVPTAAASAGALARVHISRGDLEAAHGEAFRGVERISHKGVWVWASELAPQAVEAAIACSRRADAAALVQRFAAGIADRDAPLARAALWLCRGLLDDAAGDRVRALEAFAEAEQAYRALPRPYDAARCAVRRGACLLAGGDSRGAAPIAEALAVLDRLGASGDAAAARALVPAHSLESAPIMRRPLCEKPLSGREAEVVEMVSRGCTNREIAGALGLSRRTVEHNVASAMRKLGVRSRVLLATRWLAPEHRSFHERAPRSSEAESPPLT